MANLLIKQEPTKKTHPNEHRRYPTYMKPTYLKSIISRFTDFIMGLIEKNCFC